MLYFWGLAEYNGGFASFRAGRVNPNARNRREAHTIQRAGAISTRPASAIDMTTASPTKAAHVLVVGQPTCDAELRQWLDAHAHVEHVGTFDEAIEALRTEPFDMVLSGAAELLPTPSLPLTRPATTILDSLAEGVCLVRGDGEVEWANARMLTLPDAVREQVRTWCVELLRSSEQDAEGKARPLHERRRSIRVDGDSFEVRATPIADRHYRIVQVAALVEAVTHPKRSQARADALDQAGVDLLTVDVQHFCRLEPHERLALLEQKILRGTQEILQTDSFEIRFLDRSTNRLDLVMCAGLSSTSSPDEMFALAQGNGICGFVAVSGRGYLCSDVPKDPRALPVSADSRSAVTVPIRVNERVVGVASFESNTPGAFGEEDLRLAESFALHIGLALHMLTLLAGERQSTICQLGRSINGEITAPVNDILTDVEALLDECGANPAACEKLHAVSANANRIRDTVKELTAARPCLVGASTASTRRVDPILEGRRVLLADDEEILRDTVRDVLSGYGCCVRTAADGGSAIEWIAKEPFDLVLSDIKMPVRSGYEVFAAAKQANPKTPVILTTGFGYDPNHSIIRARREGLAAVLFKPFKVDQLLHEIRTALKAGSA